MRRLLRDVVVVRRAGAMTAIVLALAFSFCALDSDADDLAGHGTDVCAIVVVVATGVTLAVRPAASPLPKDDPCMWVSDALLHLPDPPPRRLVAF